MSESIFVPSPSPVAGFVKINHPFQKAIFPFSNAISSIVGNFREMAVSVANGAEKIPIKVIIIWVVKTAFTI